MLSVIGGLWVMSGSSPLAAQAVASASRSFDPSTVAPDGQVTVTIEAADYGQSGGVTETLPAGFAYVSSSLDDSQVLDTGQMVRFTLQGDVSFTYIVTASSTEGSYTFSGMLRDFDRMDSAVGGVSEVTVSATDGTTPDPTPVAGDDLQFDVVPAKAVKGAVVSGLNNPIGTKTLEWVVDTGGAAATIAGDGLVGDFRVVETSEGSGKFQLLVENSDAPALSGTQVISVDVTYEVDGADVTETLTGNITQRSALAFTNSPFDFTISQAITAGTPIVPLMLVAALPMSIWTVL